MNPLNLITDSYGRQARLFPALLLLAPVVFTGFAAWGGELNGAQSLMVTIGSLGGAFLLTQLARDAGKKGEKKLFEMWGGLPSIAIFRHCDTRLDPVTKIRYHKKLAALVKEAKAPTPEQEQANPSSADSVYSAWSNYLRVNTRDTKKFGLLFNENVNYGYRRNVWGLRLIGILVSSLSVVVSGIRVFVIFRSKGELDEMSLAASVFAGIMVLLWVFRFTPDWARVPADAYAERLAESVETIGVKATPARTPAKKSPPKK